MARNILIILFVIVLVGTTGLVLYRKVTDEPEQETSLLELSTPSPSPSMNEDANPTTTPTPGPTRTLEGGLQVQDLVIGDGEEAQDGMTVTVHYAGWLTDGTKFDSSVDRGQPFQFIIGAGQVIRGWDLGVVDMRVGGVRNLIIPPELGYGAQGAGGGLIPPNATLLFQVQLLGVGQ